MKRFLQWLDRWMRDRETVSPALGPVMLIHNHCPHCEARTACEVNVLRGYQRCLRCGREPRDRRAPDVEPDQAKGLVAA